MTETITEGTPAPSPPAAAPEPPEDDQRTGGDDPGTDATDDSTPNAEAARYRRRLREVEAERDALADKVESLQRAQALAQAAGVLSQPADLFEVGRVDLAALLNADGDLDAGAVAAALDALIEARPGLAIPREPSYKNPHAGPRDPIGGGRPAAWGDVLGKEKRV